MKLIENNLLPKDNNLNNLKENLKFENTNQKLI